MMILNAKHLTLVSCLAASSVFADEASVIPIEVPSFEVKSLDISKDSIDRATINLTQRDSLNPQDEIGLVIPNGPVTLSFEPMQYSATYESEYQGRKVKGKRSLIKEDNGWLLKTSLTKMVVSVTEETLVTIDENLSLIPQYYEYHRSVFGVKKRQKLEYDYQNSLVHFKDGDDSGSYPLLPHTVDKASQQFLIEEHLRRGSTQFASNTAARNRNKAQEYRVLGEEYIELPIGVTKAIKVEIVPDKTNSRYTVMWFDAERNYILVQLNQTDKNGKTYTMKLSDVKFLD